MNGSPPTAPPTPRAYDGAPDSVGRRLLAEQQLTAERPISDDGDSFVTLLCRDAMGERVVLKYVRPDAPADAYRRLRNEALLMQKVRTEWPLRLLRHRASGAGYLVSELDRGRLLRPAGMDNERVARAVATSLAVFQDACRGDVLAQVQEREPAGVYYLKVLGTHLLHLWPSALGTWECLRATAIVIAALPWMLKRSAPAHGDCLPTNLLYHDDDDSVTFTDLESFTRANHPLFDALALCTVDERELSEWSWQPVFLRSFLTHVTGSGRLNPQSKEFRRAYRGILTFFLVYRLNEARVGHAGGRYFDGLGRSAFIRRRLAALLGRRTPGPAASWPESLETRRRNLRRVLPASGFRAHLQSMRAFDVHSGTP